MSSNTQNDETSQRLGRLKAMQARRKEVIDRAVPSTAVRPDVTEVTAVQPAKAGGAGGGRAALIQQVRKLITGPNGTIDQKKAKLLVQFLATNRRRRSWRCSTILTPTYDARLSAASPAPAGRRASPAPAEVLVATRAASRGVARERSRRKPRQSRMATAAGSTT